MRHLLDTNIVSQVIRGDEPRVRQRLAALPMGTAVISAVTEAELHHGLARRSHPTGLSQRVQAFLVRVDGLPWDSAAASAYGGLRVACKAAGVTLAPLDLMIAARARSKPRSLPGTGPSCACPKACGWRRGWSRRLLDP
jgi:tRNA(fMet)-specific endonuclease VapC